MVSNGKKLGAELVRLREAAGFTPAEVERRTRGAVSSSSIMLLEAGTQNPSVRYLRALATVYGVTPWSVLALAGYVTDQDARDGIEALRARKRAA